MLHVPALPGSPQNKLAFEAIVDWVLSDAKALAAGGIDGFILENFGDAPFYPHRVPPHTVAFMAVLAREVKRQLDLPLGINVLRNDSASALGIAAAIPADFIRVNVYTVRDSRIRGSSKVLPIGSFDIGNYLDATSTSLPMSM